MGRLLHLPTLGCAMSGGCPLFSLVGALQVRKEVEGSFFLIAKTLSPFHQIIILNKKNAGDSSWTSHSVSKYSNIVSRVLVSLVKIRIPEVCCR